MAITINGTANTVAGVAAGGINDNVVDNGTMADDAIGIAELSATGTASSSTFLRGDNSWATPSDNGKVLQYVHVQSTGSNYFDADNAFQDIPNTTITVTTTKLNSKILIQWNCGIAQETSSGDTDEVSFRVKRTIGGVDATVREDNQWSYFNTSTSWLGPGQFHMMHLDSPAQAASTAVQYKLMGLVQNSNSKIWMPYGESGQSNNMQIVAMELDV